jgi:hypothetical protein
MESEGLLPLSQEPVTAARTPAVQAKVSIVSSPAIRMRGSSYGSMNVIGFFNWPNPSSRTMSLGSTQSLTEMSTSNRPGGKGRPAREANNPTAICEPIV